MKVIFLFYPLFILLFGFFFFFNTNIAFAVTPTIVPIPAGCVTKLTWKNDVAVFNDYYGYDLNNNPDYVCRPNSYFADKCKRLNYPLGTHPEFQDTGDACCTKILSPNYDYCKGHIDKYTSANTARYSWLCCNNLNPADPTPTHIPIPTCNSLGGKCALPVGCYAVSGKAVQATGCPGSNGNDICCIVPTPTLIPEGHVFTWLCVEDYFTTVDQCVKDNPTDLLPPDRSCKKADLSDNHCINIKKAIRTISCSKCSSESICRASVNSKSNVCVASIPTPTTGPTPTPTRTPTPTPVPSCSDYGTCARCVERSGQPWCGWKGTPSASGGSNCESGTPPYSCPAGYTNWYWSDCSTNTCAVPPTPTTGPTPTITPTPTSRPCSDYEDCDGCVTHAGQPWCGWTENPDSLGSYCESGTPPYSCPAGYTNWYWSDCSTNTCAGPTPTPTPTPQQCDSCNIRNLSCPGFVTAGDLFEIKYEFKGTGPKYPYEHRAWKLEGSEPIQAKCSYGGNWPDCVWNKHSFDVIAPSQIRKHTYTVTCYGASEVNSSFCGIADDSKQCTVEVIAPPPPTSGPTPTITPTPTPIPGFAAQQQRCNATRSGWDNIGGGVCVALPSCSNPIPPTPTPTRTPTPTPTPTPVYSISGTFFVDINRDGKKNRTETNHTGSATVSYSGGTVNNSGGTYSITSLSAGQYTLTFAGLPANSVFTYPLIPLIVTVGSGCSVPATSEAICIGNSIVNLNAGVTDNKSAWFQSIGSDMRLDSGFTNKLPSEGEYASIPVLGGMPGIIFSGTITPDFGKGAASQFHWKVFGSSADKRDVFTDTHNLIPTSYRFLLETADSSGITINDIAGQCIGGGGIGACALNGSLPHGIYKANGNLTLVTNPYTFPAAGNFIILVKGNLTINGEIIVPIGSTVIFSASGNITVNRSVGTINPSSARSNIEGLYSADNDFVADGANDCASRPDIRLNVAGTVIANAARGGGTFVNNRDLCISNLSNPSVSFIERPDFLLNYPSFVGQTTRAWQEVAP